MCAARTRTPRLPPGKALLPGQKNLRPIGTRKLLQAQGDHDGSYGTAQMSTGAMFGAIFRSQAEDERRHFGGDGSYFYVDDPAAKMRLIVLNSCWTDSAHLRTASFGYGNTQLNWLADTALSFSEDGWCVALFAHGAASRGLFSPDPGYDGTARDSGGIFE